VMHLKLFLRYVIYLVITLGVSSSRAGPNEDFFFAVQRDDEGSVAALLKRGFDPNTVDPAGRPGLTAAIQVQSLRVVQALMNHPSLNVNALNAKGESALMLAALKGDMASSLQLLERGARVNQAGWAPIHYAATGTEPRLVGVFLDRGAEIEARSPNGTTPLMMAARYGHEDSVKLLLSRGADPKRRNDKGLQAADFARLEGREWLAGKLEALQR
jgi:uncharacterized protein